MERDPIRVCELLVGLGDVEVLGVDDEAGRPLGVHVRCRTERPWCAGCGGSLWSKEVRAVVFAGPAGVWQAGEVGVAQTTLGVSWRRMRVGIGHRATTPRSPRVGRC